MEIIARTTERIPIKELRELVMGKKAWRMITCPGRFLECDNSQKSIGFIKDIKEDGSILVVLTDSFFQDLASNGAEFTLEFNSYYETYWSDDYALHGGKHGYWDLECKNPVVHLNKAALFRDKVNSLIGN